MFDHHSLDPRSKLAFTLAVIGVTIILPDFRALAIVSAVVLLLVAVGQGLSVLQWIGFIRPLKLLIPVIFVLNLLFYSSGARIWKAPVIPVSITYGGLETSTLIVLRLVIIAGVAAWFATTTTAEEFEVALVRLGTPWSLAFVLSLTLRLIPEMRSRYQTIEEAQRSRGLSFDGGPIQRARKRIPTFIPFFVSVIEFGYELTDALVVRDFGHSKRRTSLVSVDHQISDYALYGLSVTIFVSLIVVFK